MLMTISSSTESTDSPCCELFIEICKISALGFPNQLLIKSKKLGDSVYGTLKHFFSNTREYIDVD